MKTSRQIRTLTVAAVIFCLTVTVSFSASVRLYVIDPFTNARDTNDLYATAVGSNVLANGGVVSRGIPKKLTPTTDGSITNTFAVGHYAITNRVLGSGFVIRVPDNSSLYDYTNLLVSGYNTFVTIENGDSGTAVTATNLAQAITNGATVTINVSTGAVVTVAQQQMAAGTNPVTAASISASTGNISALTGSTASFTALSGLGTGVTEIPYANLTASARASVTNAAAPQIIATNAELVTRITAATNNSAQTWDAEVPAIMATNGTVVFNVEKYGAAPGVESTVGIQAAINAAQAVAGIVYFPSNNYLTSNTLTFSSLVHFLGNNGGTTTGFTISNTTGSDVIAGAGGIYNFTMSDLSLVASTNSATNVILRLSANASSGFGLASLKRLTAQGGRVGLLTSNLFTSELIDCRFLGQPIGVNFTGVAVGRIKIEGGGAGSGNGIGYVVDQGTYFVFDGVDMGGTTNMIKVNRAAFVTLQNCNLEGGLLSSDDTMDRAYVLFNPTNSSGLLRVINTRFGAGNGSPLTLSHSITVSNAMLEVGGGNTFSHVGPTGQFVEEWDTIPCSTYCTVPENYGSQLWVTNRTSAVARKPRQYIQDLQNSGRSSNFSNPLYWGAVWYDSRASGASDSLYHHIKLANNTYHGVDLFDFFKRTKYLYQLGLGSNAFTGYSGASSQLGIDSVARWLMVGSDNNATTRTDATFKSFGFVYPPYNTARGPVLAMTGYAGDAGDGAGRQNRVTFGGGTSAGDASTILDFNTGALDSNSSTTKLRITGSGIFAYTNFHAVAVTATNFIAMPTNYVAANFAPVSGMVKLVTSNDWIYSVTTLATNRAFQINP